MFFETVSSIYSLNALEDLGTECYLHIICKNTQSKVTISCMSLYKYLLNIYKFTFL